MTDQDGIPVHDERGKIRYVNLVNFTTRARRDTLTQQILVALQRKHPEVFD